MLRKLAAALVFAIGIGFIAFADTDWVRYSSVFNSHVCLARQMMTLPRDVDVVVLGSSRMRRGVGHAEIAAASGGRFVNVYNLSQPGHYVERNGIMLRDMIARGQHLDVVIVEANIDALRDGRPTGWNWKAIAAGYARWSDIVTNTPRTLDGGARSDPRVVLNGLYDKLQASALLVSTGVVPAVMFAADARPTHVCWADRFDVVGPAAERQHRRALTQNQRRYRNLDTAFDTVFKPMRGERALVELQGLARIRGYARQLGAHLVIVHPQSYADPPYSSEVVQSIQGLIPEFRYPPPDLVRQLNRLQIDDDHFGPEGRQIYSQWLTETVLEETGAADTPAQSSAGERD